MFLGNGIQAEASWLLDSDFILHLMPCDKLPLKFSRWMPQTFVFLHRLWESEFGSSLDDSHPESLMGLRSREREGLPSSGSWPGLQAPFRGGLLTWLLAGSLSPSSWGPSHRAFWETARLASCLRSRASPTVGGGGGNGRAGEEHRRAKISFMI